MKRILVRDGDVQMRQTLQRAGNEMVDAQGGEEAIEPDRQKWEEDLLYTNELPTLHQTIEKLKDLTFDERDQLLQATLADLESQLMESRETIVKLTAMEN